MTLPSYDSAIATYTYFDLTRHGSRGHTLWPPNCKGLILTYKSQKVSKWKLPNLEKYIYIFCIYTLTYTYTPFACHSRLWLVDISSQFQIQNWVHEK